CPWSSPRSRGRPRAARARSGSRRRPRGSGPSRSALLSREREVHDESGLVAELLGPDVASVTLHRPSREEEPEPAALAERSPRDAEDLLGPRLRELPLPPADHGRVRASVLQ